MCCLTVPTIRRTHVSMDPFEGQQDPIMTGQNGAKKRKPSQKARKCRKKRKQSELNAASSQATEEKMETEAEFCDHEGDCDCDLTSEASSKTEASDSAKDDAPRKEKKIPPIVITTDIDTVAYMRKLKQHYKDQAPKFQCTRSGG